MKIRYIKVMAFLGFLCMTLHTQKSKAQLISSEVFLQGDYVEVGIAKNGAFGTDNAAPSGYHPRYAGGTQLGFVADIGKDGWSAGTPNYVGDYFLPGSPQEGWDMQVGGVWHKHGEVQVVLL